MRPSVLPRLRTLSVRTEQLLAALVRSTSIPRVRRIRRLLDTAQAIRNGLIEQTAWPTDAPLRAFVHHTYGPSPLYELGDSL